MAEEKKKRIIRVALVVIGIIVVSLIFNKVLDKWDSFRSVIDAIFSASMPIIVGCIIAFLLNPILVFFDRLFHTIFQDRIIKDKRRLFRTSRCLAIIFTIVIFLGVISGLLYMVIPQLYDSIKTLIANMQEYYQNILDMVDKLYEKFDRFNISEDELTEYINTIYKKTLDWAENDVLPNVDKIVMNIGTGVIGGFKAIYNFLIGIIASIYIMANKEYLASRCKKIIYAVFSNAERANLFLDGMSATNRIFGQFINGKIVDSIVIGLLAFVVFSIVQMPYTLLISVIIGVTNVIPFFGPIIGAIPCFFIVLVADPVMSLILLIIILVLQQFDGNILGPKILGDSIGLSSLWILVAVIVGGGLFGFAGMLLAVPVFTCCYTYINRVCTIRLKKKAMPYATDEYRRIKRLDSETGEPIYVTEEEEDIRFKKKTPEEKQQLREEKLRKKMEKKKARIHFSDFRNKEGNSAEMETAATENTAVENEATENLTSEADTADTISDVETNE